MDISNLDPDLAALLEDIPVAPSAPASPLDLFDDIGDDILLSASPQASGSSEPSPARVDLTIKEFPKVKRFYNDTPHTYFDSADFLKAGAEFSISSDKNWALVLTICPVKISVPTAMISAFIFPPTYLFGFFLKKSQESPTI